MIQRQQFLMIILLLVASISVIYPTPARTLFYIATMLCGMFLLIDLKRIKLKNILIIISLVIFGILQIGHAFYFDSELIKQYPVNFYIGTGTRLLCVAILISYLSSYSGKALISSKIVILTLGLACALIIGESVAIAIAHPELSRLTTLLPATSYAYISSTTWLIYTGFMFQGSKNKWLWLIYVSLSIGMMYVIFATGTRIAWVASPLIWFFIILISKNRFKFFIILCGVAVGISAAWVAKPHLMSRIYESQQEIKVLQANQYDFNKFSSSNSLRLQAYQQALAIGYLNPILGKGWGFRTQKMHESAASAALLELNYNHLHNDILEQWSIRGVFGVFTLLFLILSLSYLAISKKNLPLLALVGSMFIWMQTDVIFFAKDVVMFYGLYMVILVVLSNEDMLLSKKDVIA